MNDIWYDTLRYIAIFELLIEGKFVLLFVIISGIVGIEYGIYIYNIYIIATRD